MTRACFTRRSLLLVGAAACVAPIAAAADYTGAGMTWAPNLAASPTLSKPDGRYLFFTAAEAQFMEAACARLIPDDATGPGAVQAGVPAFIDRQLGGEYGQGARLYMKGPFGKGTKTQGYQNKAPPAGFHRAAIAAIGDHLAKSGKPFHEREAAEQDAFLKDLEAGKVDLGPDVDGKAYFALLLQNVMEGYFSDPIYGGNRDMGGWRMIGFSGARYDQRAYVLTYNQPYPLPPVGIGGRPAWSIKG